MTIAIVANEAQKTEILSCKTVPKEVTLHFIDKIENEYFSDYDAAFFLDTNLSGLKDLRSFNIPVIINSVTDTLRELELPSNFSRINGWDGFLGRNIYEIASNDFSLSRKIFEMLQWQIIEVKDDPGLIAARVISMIINEAYFALQDNLSSEEEIDVAMKYGTNYPLGPFEWIEKIGPVNVYSLLQKLSITDNRYEAAPLLIEKIPVSDR